MKTPEKSLTSDLGPLTSDFGLWVFQQPAEGPALRAGSTDRVGRWSTVSTGRVRRWVLAGLIVAALAVWTRTGRAELAEWLRNVEGTGRFHDALFRTVSMPGGPVEVRRAPAEAHGALTALGAEGADRALAAMRARAAEDALDPTAAETAWREYARLATDAGEGQLALADFYHRRLMAPQEGEALAAAARAADPPADRLLPPQQRRAWRTFERIFGLVDEQRLPATFAETQARAWIERYPQEQPPYQRLVDLLAAQNRAADADGVIAAYQKAVPSDEAFPVRARAGLAMRRGSATDALAVYDQAFQPLWDADLVRSYFDQLEQAHELRRFLDRARADLAARPDDVAPIARVFYYYQRTGNTGAAEQTLADFETRRESKPRTAGELLRLAALYEKTRNLNEAIRYHASTYSLPGASPADREQALARIIETLFTASEQPLRLGAGDLSFYKDIATLDRGPGFLNGVLSLLFNTASPQNELAREESTATPYFHRARAADLVKLFDATFPASTRRVPLHALLIETYAGYGEASAVIEHGRRFLAAFPSAPQRTAVALAMADAFAQQDRVAEELATYDRLLVELAAAAEGVPLGAGTAPDEGRAEQGEGTRPAPPAGARSADYARTLDRYVARLVSRKQLTEALAIYRREIDRNPGDPGLYEATARFIDQNDLGAEIEQVYRRAIEQFPDASWHHRLARWYVRRNRAAAFETLTRDVVHAFDGTALGEYFDGLVVRGPAVSASLYLQLNLYAHERFPHHLTFVRNLLGAYTARETRNDTAYEALLRRHWFEDAGLAAQFFEWLSRTKRLDAEIAEVRRSAAVGPDWAQSAKANPVAIRFLAEADIWRSKFEPAAPVLHALAGEYPSDVDLGRRAGSLHRSLSYTDARETDLAAAIGERLNRYDPRDSQTLTTLGEIHADRELYDRARPFWDRIPELAPGRPSGYLEAATIFWDYYQFDDALRVITKGRTTLGDAALYAYEAGAIHEGLRQPERAIDEYVRGAIASGGESPAQSRILTLAKRPAYRALADRATAVPVEAAAPSPAAVSLRIAVLEAQSRRDDLERFLLALVGRTSSLELMVDVANHAERLGLESVRTASLARQIEVMGDPIEKLQLRYALVRLYESRGELALARQTLEALYAEHPRRLGVVRQTVDYYWRHDLRREALTTLTRSAEAAYPALKKQLTFEAARKATTMGVHAEARELLKPLLAEDPFNPEYLAATADTYALAKDRVALRDFYVATIEKMQAAPIAVDERTRRIVSLRRGLVPALTRLGDHTGAVDQYIEILNKFPEDEALMQETARYARQHGRATQLVSYYTKTADASPRDYRWPMLVARLQTELEDLPAAIAAYSKAAAIRPDRVDFQTAQGALEERLMRFDEASARYAKAYELTYRDPQWMEKIAELHARQGRTDAATSALRTALLEGRPERADAFFDVASRLEQWQMLDAARPFAEEGARIAAPAALLESGAAYVSVLTRLRQHGAVLDRLLDARSQALKALPPDAEGSAIRSELAVRIEQMGGIVASYFAPEEKRALATLLEQKAKAGPADIEPVLLPLAEGARLSDLAVRWRVVLMNASRQEESNEHIGSLIALQTSRLRFAELASQLEAFAALGGRHASYAWEAAADAYRKAGDGIGELRLLSRVGIGASGPLRDRYLELLLASDPQRLVALAAKGQPDVRNVAATHLVAHGTPDQALEGVRARGQGLPPVWTPAYVALVGLHLGRFDATTTDAFRSVLGPSTIGEALAPVDRTKQLAGDTWYAYGSRFGELLTYAKQRGADDYLPAVVERTPARSDAYVTLADFSRDERDAASALADYERAAVLNARRSDVHLRSAAILWRQQRREDAIARWKLALGVLAAQARAGRNDPAPLTAVLRTIGGNTLLPALREPADAMVRAYIARNGTYRADALLAAAFRAAGDAEAGTDWLLDLARDAPGKPDMLAAVAAARWLPDAQRDRVYERLVTLADEAAAQQYGAAQTVAQSAADNWRVQRIQSLVDTKQPPRAEELLRALPDRVVRAHRPELITIEARVAASLDTLEPLLERYRGDEEEPLALEALPKAATALRRAGNAAAARRIMEFVYTRQLDRDERSAPTLLGLAEIRIEQGNMAAAIALLRRLTLVVGEPFEQHAAAAALLERLKHPAEALDFRRDRVRAVPWDTEAQLALARTEIAAEGTGVAHASAVERLARVVESQAVPYGRRAEAARRFRTAGGVLGRAARTEIDILRASATPAPAEADRPMFVEARMTAAQGTTDPAARVTLLSNALAIDPSQRGIRLPLFRALLAAGKAADAVEAITPLVGQRGTLTNLGLSAAGRARLARELADAHQQLDQLPTAVRYLNIAIEGEPAATRPALRRRLTWLEQEIARRATNASRQPTIGESLDQPHLVRPRIPPRPFVAAPATGAAR